MSYKLSWLVEHRVLLCHQWGTLSKTDFWSLLEEIRESVITSNGPVHVITDARNVQHSELQCDDLKGFLAMQAKNAGWMIILGKGRFARLNGAVASQLLNLRSAAVATTDEAIDYLLHIDKTLPPDFSY